MGVSQTNPLENIRRTYVVKSDNIGKLSKLPVGTEDLAVVFIRRVCRKHDFDFITK